MIPALASVIFFCIIGAVFFAMLEVISLVFASVDKVAPVPVPITDPIIAAKAVSNSTGVSGSTSATALAITNCTTPSSIASLRACVDASMPN